MCDSEDIILCVEKYPCIWNPKHSDYHNRETRDFAWEQVCKELYNDWELYMDKGNRLADVKKKWNNVRDYYRKDLRNRKSGKRTKKYMYHEILYFLKPVFEKKYLDGNFSKEDNSDDPLEQDIKIENDDYLLEIKVPSSPSLDNEPTSSEPKSLKRKRAVGPENVVFLQNKQQAATEPSDDEDDTNFLLSFRTYMKQMNDTQKLDFKVGMLQLVKKIRMKDDRTSFQDNKYFDDD